MRDSTPKLIQQQIYTRERRGIFRSTEGFDTIAKSSGLDSQFVKKQLHPLCIYDAPAELSALGEKDSAAYPETVHYIRLDNGDRLFGRSIYQAADFTGLRSAFFSHNYVIAAESAEKFVSDYTGLLRTSFKDSYNINDGSVLPELASLPIHRDGASLTAHRSVLRELNIGEQQFKQLLYAVMSSVGGKKKVYVALDVPIQQLPERVKQLLHIIYASLPYAFRRLLGFVTYAKEPQSKKAVHLTFVEKGSLRIGDRNIEKDFIFDFANDRITNLELDWTEQPYLSFAWDNLERNDRAERFYHFADIMLAGMELERETAVGSYHELSIVFQIEEGNESLYEAHKSTVLRAMLNYLQPAGSLDSKIRLNDLFLSRFDYEYDLIMSGQLPETTISECIKDYYRVDGKHNEGRIIAYFVRAIALAHQLNKKEAVAAFYATIESEPNLSVAFFAKISADKRLAESLFEPYLEAKLKDASSWKEVLSFIGGWGADYPELLNRGSFHTLAREQLVAKLHRESNILWGVSQAIEQLQAIGARWANGRKNIYGADELIQELCIAVYRMLLTKLNLDMVSKAELLKAEFLSDNELLELWHRRLSDQRLRSAALVLSAAYEWFKLPQPDVDLFDRLSPMEVDSVQRIGKNWLSGNLDVNNFGRLVLAFHRSSDMEIIDYSELIDFIRNSADEKEMVYQFFQWTERQPAFMRSRGFVPAYKKAIITYFQQYDRDALKKRANWKHYFGQAGSDLQAVYKQAKQELSSPWRRFVQRNSKGLMIFSVISLCILVGGVVMLQSLKDDGLSELTDPPSEVGNLEPGDIVTPDINTPDLAKKIVYTEQAGVGEEETTALVFLFNDETECTAFAPGSLTIVTPDELSLEFITPSITSSCITDNAASDEGEHSSEGSEIDSQMDYSGKVIVRLDKLIDIPLDSKILVDESEYILSAQPDDNIME